jgi:hypothetical protein
MDKSVIIFLGLFAILILLGSSNMNIANANAITEFDNIDQKQVSVSSFECNQNNVNVNGLELDEFLAFLANGGLSAEAVDGNTDPSSIVGNKGDGSQINDLRVICQNNNNKVTEGEEEPTPPTPPSTNLDLAVASFTLENPVSIRLGNGNGTFTSAPDVPVGNQPTSVIVGFFNADANLDLAVSNNVDNDVSIRLGNGDGTFTSAPDVVVGGDPLSVTAGFLNADSNLDLAVPSQNDGNVSIRLGIGDGTFTTSTTSPPDVPVGEAPAEVTLGLFNSDSNLDMAVVDLSNGVVSISLGNGDGTFTSAPDVQVGSIPKSIAVKDINADSNLDLVVPNQKDNDLSIRLGIGDGTFTTSTTSPPDVPVKETPQSVAVRNFDNN